MNEQEEIEELRKLAHDAPMNKVFETHDGHRFLGTHSRAWADAADRYVSALSQADSVLEQGAQQIAAE